MAKKKEKKKGQWKQILPMIFMVGIGGVCGALMAEYALGAEESGRGMGATIGILLLLFLWMYVSMFLHTAIHEAGHLVGGLLSGYQFSSYRIGSFMWMKVDGKIRLKRMSLAGTGGQCLMLPPDMVDGKIPYVLYNLGGSLANVLVSCLALIPYFLLEEGAVSRVLLLIFAVVGLITGAMNGIPMRMGMVDNDGYNAFSLGKNPAALRAFWIQMKGNELISRGGPRERYAGGVV